MDAQDLVIKKEKNKFKSICYTPLQDSDLSYMARGIYGYIMSKPDDWEGHVFDIKKNSKTDSLYKIRIALKELSSAGYAILRKVKKKDGTYSGSYYEFFNEKTYEF